MKVETVMDQDQVLIETERFVLRPPKASDVGICA